MARKAKHAKPRRPNPVARELANAKFRRRVVQDKRRRVDRAPIRHEADAGPSLLRQAYVAGDAPGRATRAACRRMACAVAEATRRHSAARRSGSAPG